jgi:hypothetical protein
MAKYGKMTVRKEELIAKFNIHANITVLACHLPWTFLVGLPFTFSYFRSFDCVIVTYIIIIYNLIIPVRIQPDISIYYSRNLKTHTHRIYTGDFLY